MLVGVDVSALAFNTAGTATYIRGLLQGLRLTEKNQHLRIIELSYSPFFGRHHRWLRIIDAVNRDIVWINTKLPKKALANQCDLIHSPAMMAPRKCRLPLVLTVLDLYIFRNRSAFPIWLQTIMFRRLPKVLKNSAKIIAISQFTKQEILDFFPDVNENKIMVTHLGVDSIFKKVADEESLQIKSKYGLAKPFIITVSTIEPRKNLKNLLRSYALVQNKLEHDLVIVGAYGWKSADHMTLIHKLKLEGRVKYTGYVDTSDLPALYSAADIFIYPSLYEGFGLPPLEAMACGCPVITSNCSSLPEVVGDAAIQINPKNIEQLAFAIECLIANNDMKEFLREAGLKRASEFSWERCAQETIEAYKQAIQR